MTREEAIERIKARFDKWALDNEDTKAIQALIPDLREDEDEKVRSWLLTMFKTKEESFVRALDNYRETITLKQIISYLENLRKKSRVYDEKSYHQVKRESWNSYEPVKEKLTIEELFYKGFYEGYQFGIHEEKPHIWTKHDEAVRKEAIACLQQWGNNFPINGIDYSNILHWLKEELSVHTKKGQKTTDELTVEILTKAGLKPYKDGNKWCILAGENIQEGICGFGDTVEEALYEFLLDVLDIQKKRKWSEEDKEMVKFYLDFTDYKIGCWPNTKVIEMRKKFRNWLKSLPERFVLQPKQEWSKEDGRMIDTIVSVLGQYIDYKAVSGTGSGYATPKYSKEIDWLNSLRSSWKPSGEQMMALRRAVNKLSNSDIADSVRLSIMHDNLKKLM